MVHNKKLSFIEWYGCDHLGEVLYNNLLSGS